MNEDHLYEIFGQFGPVKDLDLPINRTSEEPVGTNRGTAYILFDHEADAEAAISHLHEAQVDGATINVSITAVHVAGPIEIAGWRAALAWGSSSGSRRRRRGGQEPLECVVLVEITVENASAP
ncbi:Nucleotide-binding, alpha-beta plait [Moelleriella libera RCEF 2490]|uniref:Nucleotide-binding, alpha-beta plait n=1 Tax=Moelleriella libera RCEF 2490 TaxID=1081109 RepID=A0A168DF45_9HYPO|nr:Nucleotide-binding, alpha-beta plait [Moelleriella libera RCEF 2490]